MRVLVLLAVLGVCSAVPFIQDTPEVQAEKALLPELPCCSGCCHSPAGHPPPRPPPTAPRPPPSPSGMDPWLPPSPPASTAPSPPWATPTRWLPPAPPSSTPTTPRSGPQLVQRLPFPSFAPAYSPAPAVRAAPVQPKWTGPVAATVPAGLPGSAPQVADTPEVAAAKQEFFNTFQRQAAAAAPPSRNYF
nr:cuticle protein CP1499-like isoform X2 [Penaeus vannamei]